MGTTPDTRIPKRLSNIGTSGPSNEEKTLVVYGEEKTIDLTVRFLNNAKECVECCLDSTVVSAALGVPHFMDALQYAKKR